MLFSTCTHSNLNQTDHHDTSTEEEDAKNIIRECCHEREL